MAKQFTINIPQSKLDDLQSRLAATILPSELGDGWSYGADVSYMKELLHYWKQSFDWRTVEKELNTFNNLVADIDNTKLHFIHQRSDNPDATPLLLIHGWPDSFYRFHKVIPELIKKFHVIVPSLPGFGFSEKVAVNSSRAADLLARLMHDELGYATFAVSSGDMGTPIVRDLATNHKELVSFVHLTDIGYPTGAEDFASMTPAEQTFAGQCQQWWYTEGAYTMEQSTKPQTLAFALTDSPIGLAAWMVEKFQAWSDGGIAKAFTKDEILTNISIYYFTNTIATAIGMYAENARALYATGGPKPLAKIDVPTAIASFPAETVRVVEDWAKRNARIVRFTEMPKGGHFAALEEPKLFAKDIEDTARTLEV